MSKIDALGIVPACAVVDLPVAMSVHISCVNQPNKSPCNHILTPDQGGFIYTPKTSLDKEADGKFCCRTVKAGSTVFTGAVPLRWLVAERAARGGSTAGSYASNAWPDAASKRIP